MIINSIDQGNDNKEKKKKRTKKNQIKQVY